MSEWIDGAVDKPSAPHLYTEAGNVLWAQHKKTGLREIARNENLDWRFFWWTVQAMPEPYTPPEPETVLEWNKEGSVDIVWFGNRFCFRRLKSSNTLTVAYYDTDAYSLPEADGIIRDLAIELNKAFKLGWVRHEYPAEAIPEMDKPYLLEWRNGAFVVDRTFSRAVLTGVVAWYELPEEVK